MSISSTLLIQIAFIALFFIIGIILGIVFTQFSGRGSKSQPGEASIGTVKGRGRLQEILRLWRDPDTGRVITEFQNQAIRDPRTLSQSEREYLVRLAKDWTAWLSVKETKLSAVVEGAKETPAVPPFVDNLESPASPPDLASPDESSGALDLSNPAGPAGLPDLSGMVEPASLDDLTGLQEPVGTADLPVLAEPEVPSPSPAPIPPAAAVSPAVQDKPAAAPILPAKAVAVPLPPPPVPLSIVQQVDEILQDRLIAHPVPGLAIRLVEDPYEGVIVWVNTKKYVGVESVTDPEVRAIIRSAVVEWNHRSEK